jgi:aspartate-semialdehyde dehydrogenase
LDRQTQVVLIGSESLLGREIRDVVATSAPELNLRLIAADQEQPGTLTRQGEEPALVEELTAQNLVGASVVILAGSGEASRKVLKMVAGSAPVIDLTNAAEDQPDTRVRAPMLESEVDSEEDLDRASVHVIAHPAAIAVALFLRRLQSQEPVRRSVINILGPASEHGKAGVEELQKQTVSLLSFKQMPRGVFDAQLSFNLLARYGEEAPVTLENSELRIERHLATLLSLPGEGEGAPMPSLRLIQAPVFHGYSFSAWVEFESNPGTDILENALVSGAIEVRSAEFEPPTNVGHAGQSGIAVGAIGPDRNEAEACWFWLVADNLRLLAENGVALARKLV